MHTQPQPGPRYGHALAAILAVAAITSLMVAADSPPTNEPSTPAAAAATSSGNGTAQTTGNGTAQTSGNIENDLLQLQNWLNMPPDRLKQLRVMIDKLDDMSLAERIGWQQEVERRLQSVRELSQEIRGDIRALPKQDDRSILNRYMLTLFPEDIQTLLKRFQDAKDKPEVRQQIIQEMLKKAVALGIKPAPNTDERGAPPGGPRGGRGRNPNNNGGGRGGPRWGPPAPPTIPAPEPPNPSGN